MNKHAFFLIPNSNISSPFFFSEQTQSNDDVQNEKLSFADLNADCQILIVEHLDAIDLLSFADAINTKLFAIEYVFRRRYETKVVTIEAPYIASPPVVHEIGDRIEIYGLPIISRFFRHFGHAIKFVQITLNDKYFSENEIFTILKSVNLHCSKTLNVFTLLNGNSFKISLEAFEKPFEHVTNVSIGGELDSLGNSNFTFNEIFPAMNSLSMKYLVELHNKSSLEQRFPHLKTLRALIWVYNFDIKMKFDENSCKQIIENNQQIQNLNFIGATRSLLKFVAENLPQLEHLDLQNYEDVFNGNGVNDFNPIRFKHLKSCENPNKLKRIEYHP